MIIDPQSVSFSTIKNNLVDKIQAKPDYQKWKDFYDSGVGVTLIEQLAGFGTFLQYNAIVNRRETYLFYAENRSSVVASAQSLGYSVFRGSNPHVRLTVMPSSAQVLKKFDVIGSYEDYDVIALQDYAINSGVSIDVDVVFGELKSETITATSPDLAIFRFESNNVSDDIYLSLEDVEVPVSSSIFDLLNDKYVAQTNALGAVDLMYVNSETASYPYDNGSVFELKFPALYNISFTLPSDLNKVSFNYGSITDAEVLSSYQTPEPKRLIRINAPIFHETQMVIRGREDFKKLMFGIIPNVSDVNGRDISAAVVGLTYVRDDLSLLTPTEKTNALNELNTYRPFGVSMPEISDPTQIDLEVTVTITLSMPLSGLGQSQIEGDVDTVIDEYEKQLENMFDIDAIEYEIERLTYVKIARVEITSITNDWQATTGYVVGKLVTPITPNDYYYVCTVAGVSGGSEPVWPTVPGNTVVDGTAEWTCRDPNVTYPTPGWDEYFVVTTNVVLA